MLKDLTIRTTTIVFAAAILLVYVAGAILLLKFAPIWALVPYLGMGFFSMMAKYYFVGIPGSDRFHQNFAD